MSEALTESEDGTLRLILLQKQICDLGRRGVIPDYPTTDPSFLDIKALPPMEISPRETTAGERGPPPKAARSFKPFPDQFVAQIISRAIWLQENLAEQLIDCWVQLREANQRAQAGGLRASNPQTISERRAIIAEYDWRDRSGAPLVQLPWPISMKDSNRSTTSRRWPPVDAASINMFVGLLQALNFCVINFCAGARSSEVLAADVNSLDSEGGRLVSLTFKTVDEVRGHIRDWPLHPTAQNALRLQLKLSDVVRHAEASHLWVLLRDGAEPAGSPLRNISEPVVQATKYLGIEHLTGGDRAHSHRWRHTVGRLIALAVVDAPQVLMDLFGHRDLEMTLQYMLSSPGLADEVLRVAEEVAYAIAEETIAEVDAGLAGGPAATNISEGLESFKMRRGEDELGADSMREAIQILTFGNREWNLVRPGVLCTKTVGQFGPCTKGRGTPDPGACRTDCGHRLEQARAKRQCELSLTALLAEYAEALSQGEDMLMAHIQGRILANLKRWDDVRYEVLNSNEHARAIWNESNSAR
jgi:integrase